ncbi:MAG: N-6 DNA methylase [Alphaproteobacteria bacterium]|nr:N-6 DNA methylase [Alphaproteobacteria bacterium]
MLAATRPDLAVFEGSFESWVTQHPDARFDLVVANPPYGPRGLHITEDPDRRYRQKQAWAYFLLRCLDLLRLAGIGAFVIPSGFLTGTTQRALRERVLRSHHLMSAFRLPSELFPGTELVTDLLFFRARGGALPEVDAADQALVDGRYFELYPEHLLGTEVGTEAWRDGPDEEAAGATRSSATSPASRPRRASDLQRVRHRAPTPVVVRAPPLPPRCPTTWPVPSPSGARRPLPRPPRT